MPPSHLKTAGGLIFFASGSLSLDIGNLTAILGTQKSLNTASEREVLVSEIKFDSSLACLLKHVCYVQLDMSLT